MTRNNEDVELQRLIGKQVEMRTWSGQCRSVEGSVGMLVAFDFSTLWIDEVVHEGSGTTERTVYNRGTIKVWPLGEAPVTSEEVRNA